MAAQSKMNFFRQFSKKLKTFFFSKDLLSFLLFIVLSSAFWFIHALDKDSESRLNVPLRFTGIPSNITVSNQLPSSISINIKDKGLNLLPYSSDKPKPLVLDLSQFIHGKGEFTLTNEQLRSKISRYLLPSTSLLELAPNSIFVQYESMESKTVAVQLLCHLELASQYILSRRIQISPSSVKVFGSKQLLDQLKFAQTEFVVRKDIADTTTFICKLKPIAGLRFSPNVVRVRVCVEQFTDKKIQIPITSINCPANLLIRTFPAFVNVTYRVGLSQFKSINPKSVEVYFDYKNLDVSKRAKQKLKFRNRSSQISNIRIQPQEIEVLLEKK
jgi:hypothetical protein